MTENEWASLTIHPCWILEFLRPKTSDRKFRLFACACCRHVWPWIADESSRNAVVLAERFADGQATGAELGVAAAVASAIAQTACDEVKVAGDVWQPAWVPAQAALAARFASIIKDDEDTGDDGESIDGMVVANNTISHVQVVASQQGLGDPIFLLHEIFGNPFRPARIDPSWQSWNNETTTKLARTIYEERRFDLMPILANALQDAGCTDPAILDHCYGPGPHVLGCWVVDSILGKE